MKAWIKKMAQRLATWHQNHVGSVQFVFVISMIIGMFCGIGAGLMKMGVDFVTHLVFDHVHLHTFNVVLILLPMAGILIATAFTKYVIRQPMDHASERIVTEMDTCKSNLSPRLIWGPIVGCSITLGLGGSAGAEDPIAYSGAAVSSNFARLLGLPQEKITQFVGCGAAAAIAGIFMAPIGGVMFALEVLKMKQTLNSVLAIVLSSLVAALACYIMLGCHTDITFVPQMIFDMHLIPYVMLFGVFGGIYSAYYRMSLAMGRNWLRGFKNIWVKALGGGLVLGILLMLFPSLYGEGYPIIHKLMLDEPLSIVSYSPLYKLGFKYDVLLLLMLGLLLVKPFATASTNDSGGVGGDFTPTFFCGGALGFLFAAVMNHFFGTHLSLAIFAYFGMAAVMAGAIKAPLMAIFISSEITGMYSFILPLTIAAIVSYVTILGITYRKAKAEDAGNKPQSAVVTNEPQSSQSTQSGVATNEPQSAQSGEATDKPQSTQSAAVVTDEPQSEQSGEATDKPQSGGS